MNRSILIVICDFLLVSLLVFSSVDINQVANDGQAQAMRTEVATNRFAGESDLTAVMKLALEDEQKRREQLVGELTRSRTTAGEQEKELQAAQQRLQSTLQQKASLQEQFAAAQTNLGTLRQQVRANADDALITKEKLAATDAELRRRAEEAAALQQQLANQLQIAEIEKRHATEQVRASAADASFSKERLEAMEAELRRRTEEAAALQQRLAQLSQSNQTVLNEKQQLASQLQVAEVEKRHAAEQVVAIKEQVEVERAEKAKLAEGVKALASNSTRLAEEIRESRPLAPNTIFDEFMANRVLASFSAFRSGLFDTDKRKTTASVLVANGTDIFAIAHVEDTPLTFQDPGAQWDILTGTFARTAAQFPIRALSFLLQDPRVVFMPVSAQEAQQLGAKVYRISTTPFKFQDAVLVGAGESYYGECRFEIDPATPSYVRLDRNMLKGLFGKFNPSRGDLVFSQLGELLGVMANNTYCLLIKNFDATATFDFGPDMRKQNTGDTLAALHSVVQQMPSKLQ